MSSQRKSRGKIVEYPVDGIEEDMSFLEMLDVLNEGLINKGDLPVSFDHDCREEFAVLARCTSTVRPTVQTDAYLLVSCT
jgi:succinate dehydrogenase/fumarate reductase-like Fe-S protein